MHKILIMGLPGAGKTTLSMALVPMLRAIHFNGDQVREALNRDLGFSVADRLEQARRMGWMADQVARAGYFVVADFVCPTEDSRRAFQSEGKAFIVWVDRIKSGRFADTNRLFEPPTEFDLRVSTWGTPQQWATRLARQLASTSVEADT
jgi:adenylylsulfate kinase